MAHRKPTEMGARTAVALLALGASLAGAAEAYVGPGLGVGAIGALLAVAGSLFLALVAFVYYPIRRLLRGRRKPPDATTLEDRPAAPPAAEPSASAGRDGAAPGD